MSDTLAAAAAASSPRRRRRRRKSTTVAARRRRDAAARAHRTVAASFLFADVVAPGTLPPERVFVREGVLEPVDVQAMLAAARPRAAPGCVIAR